MIERYFELGVRVKWNKPADVVPPVRDGAIVDSTRQAGAMIYDGLDVVVSPKLMMTHVSILGLSMNMAIQHQWLDYAKGKTARLRLGGQDVLTGFMSGCLIAKWQAGGSTYVGHLGTMDTDPTATRNVKQAFSAFMPHNTTAFNPADAWTQNDLYDVSRKFDPPRIAAVMALVTTGGDFYSVAMLGVDGRVNGSDNTEFCVGGIKRCTPIPYAQLQMRLA